MESHGSIVGLRMILARAWHLALWLAIIPQLASAIAVMR